LARIVDAYGRILTILLLLILFKNYIIIKTKDSIIISTVNKLRGDNHYVRIIPLTDANGLSYIYHWNFILQNIRIFLDGAKNGVIVISLGTNVKWKSIGLDKIKSVILALSKLKQRILWKLDIEIPYEIPNNLMIVKWMPQNKILCTCTNLWKHENWYIFFRNVSL